MSAVRSFLHRNAPWVTGGIGVMILLVSVVLMAYSAPGRSPAPARPVPTPHGHTHLERDAGPLLVPGPGAAGGSRLRPATYRRGPAHEGPAHGRGKRPQAPDTEKEAMMRQSLNPVLPEIDPAYHDHRRRRARAPIVERVAGWSSRHRKTAVLGWLFLVVAVFAVGQMLGTKNLSQYDPGQAGQAERALPLDPHRVEHVRGRPDHRDGGRGRLLPVLSPA
jgi:hypothetical protein